MYNTKLKEKKISHVERLNWAVVSTFSLVECHFFHCLGAPMSHEVLTFDHFLHIRTHAKIFFFLLLDFGVKIFFFLSFLFTVTTFFSRICVASKANFPQNLNIQKCQWSVVGRCWFFIFIEIGNTTFCGKYMCGKSKSTPCCPYVCGTILIWGKFSINENFFFSQFSHIWRASVKHTHTYTCIHTHTVSQARDRGKLCCTFPYIPACVPLVRMLSRFFSRLSRFLGF